MSPATVETQAPPSIDMDSEHFSPYRSDGKLYGFVCIVTGATQPIGKTITKELAGEFVRTTTVFSPQECFRTETY